MPDSTCDPAKKKKILGMNANFMRDLGKFLAWVSSAGVAIVTFYFVSEAKQEQRIADNKARSDKIEERLANHTVAATRAFEQAAKTDGLLNQTLAKQLRLISKTRETLIAVNATQQALKQENGRLASSITQLTSEVRKRNGTEIP